MRIVSRSAPYDAWKVAGTTLALSTSVPPIDSTTTCGTLIAKFQVSSRSGIVRAYAAGAERATPWHDARTVASGLRVPSPFADDLILRAVRESQGTAIAVSEDAMLEGMLDLAAEGCFACPEGGATLAALRTLRATGAVRQTDRVVIYNTGSGLKYPEAWREALARRR